MDDNAIRVAILRSLKEVYDQSPHNYVSNEKILPAETATETEIKRNIKYLEDKGLIDVRWFLGGNCIAKISSYGIDILEQVAAKETENATQSDSEQTLSTLIGETKQYVDTALTSLNAEIVTKLNFAYEDLLTRDGSHNFARIAYDCREILMDFTDALFQPSMLQGDEAPPTRNQTKNKVRMMLRGRTQSETQRRLIEERMDYIMSYFDVLSSSIQKNAHPDGFTVTSEDAKACLIYTYLFMRDILKLLEAT